MSKRDVKQKSEIQLFNYDTSEIRTVYRDGEIWFVAKDVCDILELTNPTEAIKSLDDDEKMTLRISDGHSGQRGGAQFLNIISEPGLYKLIFRSNKPEAKAFSRWVTHEVLPSIRKTGKYESPRASCRRAVEAFIRTQTDPDDTIEGEKIYWVERRTKGPYGVNFVEVFDL